jgi:hypothetical protein
VLGAATLIAVLLIASLLGGRLVLDVFAAALAEGLLTVMLVFVLIRRRKLGLGWPPKRKAR